MKFSEPGLYHIYNRGNNKQPIFHCDEDYRHFIFLCEKYIATRCQVIAWCLMPNHFHFLVELNKEGLAPVTWGGNTMPAISNGFQQLQSNYAKRINKRENRTGSLFQQKTKSKLIETNEYSVTAFWYIHQNPVKASIVEDIKEWEYSSFMDYCGLRNSRLSNVTLGKVRLGMTGINFLDLPLIEISEEDLDRIW